MADFLRILNIGNTHVQVVNSEGPESFSPAGIYPTADFDFRQEKKFLPALAVSSVVPSLTAELREMGAWVISGNMPLPFAPSDFDFSTIGADRLANAAALLDGPLPAISIDFGTAITIEFVTEDRQFSGGAILPGRMLLRKSLHDHTAQLPLIALSDSIADLPGKNTAEALRIGTDRAILGAIRNLISDWQELCSPAPLRITACGGDRQFFLNHIDGLNDGGETFTIRGIRKLWKYYHAGQDLWNQK